MSNEKILTKEIAEQLLKNVNSVVLSEFTAIEDEAAESLSKHKGRLRLSLEKFPESAAILRQRPPFAESDDEDYDDVD